MKNMFSLYYSLYGEFSSKFVNKKVNSRQGYLTTKNHGPIPIYDRTYGSVKLSFISFYCFLLLGI
jgi:hypothetical protein